jgi:hypothetical protein
MVNVPTSGGAAAPANPALAGLGDNSAANANLT